MTHHTLDKPAPGSGRLERRERKAAAARNIAQDIYAERLAHVEFWRGLRARLLERDGGLCRACGVRLDPDGGLVPNALHCHHLIHRSQLGSDTLENLVSLCAQCHRRHHDGRLSIEGEPQGLLTFTVRDSKGTITRICNSAAPPVASLVMP
jgi:predicted HNH restriction endonuclease